MFQWRTTEAGKECLYGVPLVVSFSLLNLLLELALTTGEDQETQMRVRLETCQGLIKIT